MKHNRGPGLGALLGTMGDSGRANIRRYLPGVRLGGGSLSIISLDGACMAQFPHKYSGDPDVTSGHSCD